MEVGRVVALAGQTTPCLLDGLFPLKSPRAAAVGTLSVTHSCRPLARHDQDSRDDAGYNMEISMNGTRLTCPSTPDLLPAWRRPIHPTAPEASRRRLERA